MLLIKFKRTLDLDQTVFSMGEALANPQDGIYRFTVRPELRAGCRFLALPEAL